MKAFLQKKDQEKRKNQQSNERIKIEPKTRQTVSTVNQVNIISKIEEKDLEISSLKGQIAALEKELSHLKSTENSGVLRLNKDLTNFDKMKMTKFQV